MRVALFETKGIENESGGVSPEEILANMDQVLDLTDADFLTYMHPG